MMRVNQRSFLVHTDRGAVVRRNRHQLKLRRNRRDGNDWQDGREIGYDEDVQQQVEQNETVQDQDEPEAEAALDQGQEVVNNFGRTRSGRKIRQPVWRKDYDT